jgi:hypothetical protein
MHAEVLVALAPLPELVYKDSMTGGRCYNRCSRGVAQPGSAPALGAGGRAFKSPRPDQSLYSLVFFWTQTGRILRIAHPSLVQWTG